MCTGISAGIPFFHKFLAAILFFDPESDVWHYIGQSIKEHFVNTGNYG